jgi:hypothetical protein
MIGLWACALAKGIVRNRNNMQLNFFMVFLTFYKGVDEIPCREVNRLKISRKETVLLSKNENGCQKVIPINNNYFMIKKRWLRSILPG